MKKLKIGVVSICALFAGCSTISEGVDVIDIVSNWSSSQPEASNQFSYKFSDEFDVQLNRSMRANYEKISVDFPNAKFSPDNIDTRLEKWLYSIKVNDGSVRLCRLDAGFTSIEDILTPLTYAFKGVKELNQLYTYRPARNYNADLFVYSDAPEQIVKIEFVKLRSDTRSDNECIEY